MKIEQIYTKCLAQASYYIESKGEVAIIDPLREIDSYIEKSKKNNSKITYIFETHFHADFVSGHKELSEKTGSPIIFGPSATPSFKAYVAKDEESFKLGDCFIKVLHTPGHTMESACFLISDSNKKPVALFSGDTLFIGSTGRPDLAQKKGEITTEQLAGMLYDSIRTKIMPLNDDLLIYPAHGPGSLCGSGLMKKTFDSLGNQRAVNLVLSPSLKKEDFIAHLTSDLPYSPYYFSLNVALNKSGAKNVENILNNFKELSPKEFKATLNKENALILDVRSPSEFAKEHISGSIFIGLDGSFAPMVGALITNEEKPLLIVAPESREEETAIRLARVGYEKAIGFLKGGITAWKEANEPISTIESITSQDFTATCKKEPLCTLDVRNYQEVKSTSLLKNAINIPLQTLSVELEKLNRLKDNAIYVHCAGGYRSMIAISMLKRNESLKGKKWINIEGGYNSIKKVLQETV